ncbi:MAG: hypothetical protein LBF22_00775 [Deltaproteobacteria bacterium]|jgi:hypothetical protein|nr:hypothetical protein [Deltaproteobacteria bacterium]
MQINLWAMAQVQRYYPKILFKPRGTWAYLPNFFSAFGKKKVRVLKKPKKRQTKKRYPNSKRI